MSKTALNLTRKEALSYKPALSNPLNVRDRWERARGVAAQAARLLREQFGATRVVAFGSITHAGWFTPWSDIDLAAWEIPADQFFRAVAALEELSGEFELDLVDPADCSRDLLTAIERESLEL